MHRRRLGLAAALLAFVVLVAVKPKTGELRLSLDTAAPAQAPVVEAALDLGLVAVTILVRQAGRDAR